MLTPTRRLLLVRRFPVFVQMNANVPTACDRVNIQINSYITN